jgi:hypothetical protein
MQVRALIQRVTQVTHTIDQTIATQNNCHQGDSIPVTLERNKIALERPQNTFNSR